MTHAYIKQCSARLACTWAKHCLTHATNKEWTNCSSFHSLVRAGGSGMLRRNWDVAGSMVLPRSYCLWSFQVYLFVFYSWVVAGAAPGCSCHAIHKRRWRRSSAHTDAKLVLFFEVACLGCVPGHEKAWYKMPVKFGLIRPCLCQGNGCRHHQWIPSQMSFVMLGWLLFFLRWSLTWSIAWF